MPLTACFMPRGVCVRPLQVSALRIYMCANALVHKKSKSLAINPIYSLKYTYRSLCTHTITHTRIRIHTHTHTYSSTHTHTAPTPAVQGRSH